MKQALTYKAIKALEWFVAFVLTLGAMSGYSQTKMSAEPSAASTNGVSDLFLIDLWTGTVFQTRSITYYKLFQNNQLWGNIQVLTNSDYPISNFILTNNCPLYFGDGGYVYNNPSHGPATGQREIQFQANDRMSILPGYNLLHRGALQIGASSFGTVQGAAANVYFNGDMWPSGAGGTNLGYSLLLDWHVPYWNGAVASQYLPGLRGEAIDTNGNWRMNFYNVANENPLVGQAPGNSVFAFDTQGLTTHGRLDYDAVRLGVGTNYGVSWDDIAHTSLILNQNITFTNISSSRTNQGNTRTLYLYTGISAWTAAWPANWVWGTETVTNGGAPTNLPAGTICRVDADQIIDAVQSVTNILAHVTYYPYPVSIDTDAQTFWTAASITDGPTKSALNNFCISAKAHGYWANLVALWPFVGDTGTGVANSKDLKAAHNITWHGSPTHSLNGVTGDGSTAYGDTGLMPSTALSSQNNALVFVWVKSATSPGANTWPIGASTGANYFGVVMNVGSTFQSAAAGLNVFDANTYGQNAGTYSGLLGVNRTTSTQEDTYDSNALPSPFTTTATIGTVNQNLYILARDAAGTADKFNNANLTGAGVAQNMTRQNVADLNTDLANFQTALGR